MLKQKTKVHEVRNHSLDPTHSTEMVVVWKDVIKIYYL